MVTNTHKYPISARVAWKRFCHLCYKKKSKERPEHTPAAPLLSLPNELLLSIADELSAKDLNSFYQTNRRLNFALAPALYNLMLWDKDQILIWAAQKGREELAKHLLEKNANPGARSIQGSTALHVAAEHGHEEIVKLLLENNASVSLHSRYEGYTVLHWATKGGHEKVVQLLLEKGADVNARGSKSIDALHIAASNGDEAVARLLLDNGADVTSRDFCGRTALHLVSLRTYINSQFEGGAHITTWDNCGQTVVHMTEEGNETEESVAVASLLIDRGADVNARDDDLGTPLHGAADFGLHKTITVLLEKGAEANIPDNDGRTALHWAARVGGEEGMEAVKVLLDHSADINAQDDDRKTALHWAVEFRGYKKVKLLVERGIDIAVKDSNDKTALEYARSYELEKITQYLQGAGTPTTSKQ